MTVRCRIGALGLRTIGRTGEGQLSRCSCSPRRFTAKLVRGRLPNVRICEVSESIEERA
jgi:hypothetical protein